MAEFPFSQLPDFIALNASLSMQARALYWIIYSHRNRESGLCCPSMVRISGLSGGSVDSVRRWRAELRAAGLMSWSQEGRGSTVYQFATLGLHGCYPQKATPEAKGSVGATLGLHGRNPQGLHGRNPNHSEPEEPNQTLTPLVPQGGPPAVKAKRKKARTFVVDNPPTAEDVIAYLTETYPQEQSEVMAAEFLRYRNGTDWRDKGGKPIGSWKRAWLAGEQYAVARYVERAPAPGKGLGKGGRRMTAEDYEAL